MNEQGLENVDDDFTSFVQEAAKAVTSHPDEVEGSRDGAQGGGPGTTPSARQPRRAVEGPYGEDMYEVSTTTGGSFTLQTEDEADYYERRRDMYGSEYKFSNISDLQELDRLLVFETLVYRWSVWMSQGFDYLQTRIDEHQLKNNIKEYSQELRLLKQSLGIDKVARDKSKGENVSDYLLDLQVRAKEFGYHRNMQYEKAVNLIYELKSMVLTFLRCDEEERRELDLSHETIIEWISTTMVDEWEAIDEAFRENQKMWIRDI